jgi:hypothetical protein
MRNDLALGNYPNTTLYRGGQAIAGIPGAIERWVDEETVVVDIVIVTSGACSDCPDDEVVGELYGIDGTDLGPAAPPGGPVFTTENGGYLAVEVTSP